MSEAAPTVEASPPRVASRWFYGPALDLVVGCGAWSIPLLALVAVAGRSNNAAIALVFYTLSIVCNYPHYMATLYRAYRTRAEFTKYKLFTLHITVLLVLTAAFVHWSPAWAPVFFTIYTTWSPWHYTGQNFGIAMMFARRNGAEPSRADRNWLYVAFASSYLMIFLTLHTGVSDEPYVLSLDLPSSFSRVASIVCLVVFAVSAVRAVWPMLARAGARAMAAPLVVLSTQFVWFVVPNILIGMLGFRLERTSYSVGALAFMHCAQYLWITSFYARHETVERGERWRPWVYAASLVAGGIALFLPGPWLVSYGFHFDFTATFLIFGALVNIHHFVVDGAIWKLRDSRVAALLLGSAGDAGVEGAGPWTAGWPVAARALRAIAVVALLALAAVDIARFAFAGDRERMASLEAALRMNPFDVPVRTGVARVQLGDGDRDGAIETLRGAVALDPYDVVASRSLAKLLLEAGRYEEAYAQHAAMAGRVPDDVDTLVNHGTLAARFGHDGEAIDVLQRALALDEAQPIAHVQLAESLARSGRPTEAIPHFERYIELAAARKDSLGDVEHFATVLIETGDAYVAVDKPAPAATYYTHAAQFAAEGGKPSVEGAAYGRIAALLERANKPADAAATYRHAIERDEAAGDRKAAATEWFNYGQLLRKQAAAPRLVVACVLTARDGLAGDSDTMTATVDRTLAELEKATPGVTEATRRDLPAALAEARAYQPQNRSR